MYTMIGVARQECLAPKAFKRASQLCWAFWSPGRTRSRTRGHV